MEDLEKLYKEYNNCKACVLCETRNNIVFGDGDTKSKVIFIGEAPGKTEDLKGKPFIGLAGNLLSNYFVFSEMNREDYYITNIVKCRPPQNRNPRAEEIKNCKKILDAQLDIMQPKIIVPLGLFATKFFLKQNKNMGDLRGTLFEKEGILILPMYHPAALLRNPDMKPCMAQDFKLLKKLL